MSPHKRQLWFRQTLGGKHKGKGQVLFQFKCAPIHLQHNGDKEVAATSVSKKRGWDGVRGGRGRDRAPDALEEEEKGQEEEEEEEDAGSLPASRGNRRKSVLHKPAADSLGSLKATPPTHPPPHHLRTHTPLPPPPLSPTHTQREIFILNSWWSKG